MAARETGVWKRLLENIIDSYANVNAICYALLTIHANCSEFEVNTTMKEHAACEDIT